MALPIAIWKTCPGLLSDGRYAHTMRDTCTTCAPFWEVFPVCPICGKRLQKLGRTKCSTCNRYVMVVREERADILENVFAEYQRLIWEGSNQ